MKLLRQLIVFSGKTGHHVEHTLEIEHPFSHLIYPVRRPAPSIGHFEKSAQGFGRDRPEIANPEGKYGKLGILSLYNQPGLARKGKRIQGSPSFFRNGIGGEVAAPPPRGSGVSQTQGTLSSVPAHPPSEQRYP